MFDKLSPENARPDVRDLVILITDGIPKPRSRRNNQTELGLNVTTTMKENNIRILVIGIETTSSKDEFRKVGRAFATEGDYFSSNFGELESIIGGLVSSSCSIKPGNCSVV